MTERVKRLKEYFIIKKEHHKMRKSRSDPYELARKFAASSEADLERAYRRLIYVLEKEEPVLFPDERIAFIRTVSTVPEIYTEEEMDDLKAGHWIHELGDVSNINVDYTKLLHTGFAEKRRELLEMAAKHQVENNAEKADYNRIQVSILDHISALAEKYRELAVLQGNESVAESLSQVPEQAPHTFLEALQMFRILHYSMWCGRNYHNTIGRFDQYMYPYLKKDMDAGLLDEENALELLEEFFLTFNRDSDLYPGIQQGDNGQSIVLGGLNPDGTDSYNLLSELCLKASLELKLIDPKINLRIHKGTPLSTYTLGSGLTKQGLGFPQYSNDDIVIPGLMDLGYSKEDACNYAVAACWEFIIPGRAMDIPNIGALSYIEALEKALNEKLLCSETYEEFLSAVKGNIRELAKSLCESIRGIYIFPAPFLSLMMEGSTEQAKDISLGSIYNNFGFHGTGLSTAVDSIASIKKYIYEEKKYTKKELLEALDRNFENRPEMLNLFRYHSPKMGNNLEFVDEIAADLLQEFSETLKGMKNERGGIFRAGTGTAMYYIWHSKDVDATPDGRLKGEGLAANYSPGLFGRLKGPVSIVRSFSRPDLKKNINGGPLTLELHDTVFRTQESTEKVAILVKSFMDLGGHQLQLNAVNREKMLDAQKNPENYSNLIVRVWGWSGYFIELDKEYQDHIIQRMELME